jgi:isopentenyl diphosphate isomerase/L-lactate dehydrogenase-like FMN-dependent dehydrogenase
VGRSLGPRTPPAHRLVNVEDYRRIARRRLPRFIFDFIDGGAEDEFTAFENRRSFQDLALRPAVLAGVGANPGTAVEVVGQRLAMPVLIAPTGSSRLAGTDGEAGALRGAAAAGTTAVIAHGTTVPLSEIVDGVETAPWQQVLFLRDRDWMERWLDRVAALGVHALVATADVPVIGKRERDLRHDLDLPIRPRLRWVPTLARRPRWLVEALINPPITAAGLPEMGDRLSLEDAVDRIFNPTQSWEDLEWLRERWQGPLLLKGVMRGEDAARAVDLGCDGVIVSNHGGRQLDSVPSSLDALPEVVAAVGSRADVLLDGGIRRGTDVIKAVALGAKACMIGRPWLWGLRVGGIDGVADVLEILRSEIERGLVLLGADSIEGVGLEMLARRPNSGWEALGR